MSQTALESLSRHFVRRGVFGTDVALFATALVAAWNEDRSASNARELFSELAAKISGGFAGDALDAARDWLRTPGLPPREWGLIEEGLTLLRQHESGPIDWSAEAAAALANPQLTQGAFVLSMPLARSICRVIDLPITGSVACLYSASASIAWILSADRDVTLFADQEIAMVVALLARAACRSLKISRRNPLDGTFMPGHLLYDSVDHRPPFDRFDHIVSTPPFGVRVSEGSARNLSIETVQLQRLAERASLSFSTLITDGPLFRGARQDAVLREELVKEHALTVMSMPQGMYWPATGVSTSLVHLRHGAPGTVRMIDGRSMEKTSSGRVQEGLIVQHLEQFRGLEPQDGDRARDVPIDELAANDFTLTPERYLKSGHLALVEQALAHRAKITLGDIATIERNKAPQPMRGLVEDPPLTAMEIAPMDVQGGRVRAPRKQIAFEKGEEARVRGTTVRPDDILVSIKGNVGNVGIVGLEAQLAEQLNDPWIVSQSLAIVRIKPNRHLSSPAVLNALLTAPWVREKLESMSGGATVRSLPMSALRGLEIPVPTEEEITIAEAQLGDLVELNTEIDSMTQNLAARQRVLWEELWQVPADFGDE